MTWTVSLIFPVLIQKFWFHFICQLSKWTFSFFRKRFSRLLDQEEGTTSSLGTRTPSWLRKRMEVDKGSPHKYKVDLERWNWKGRLIMPVGHNDMCLLEQASTYLVGIQGQKKSFRTEKRTGKSVEGCSAGVGETPWHPAAHGHPRLHSHGWPTANNSYCRHIGLALCQLPISSSN